MNNKAQKKHKHEMKRKAKRKSLKLNNERKAVEDRAENRSRRAEYKAKVAEHNRLINLKLKKALGLPEDEEVSTETMVKAINLRNKQEREKREKEAEKQS